MITFNKPYLAGKELDYMQEAVASMKISGDGLFTRKCQTFFEEKYGFKKVLLTTSCTAALEMAAILIDTRIGDEIIVPSFTFVSSANAFVLRGAKIVFADSSTENPTIDASKIEALITSKTKAIVVMHYGGIACDMDQIMQIAAKNNLFVIEDAAHAINATYKGKPLGRFGHLATFSFHETKNIISGEGGMLVVNDERFFKRAEVIWEKGTNRSAFFRGEVKKYEWIDIGSSFLPSELIAAFLYAQLEKLDTIQKKRIALWDCYFTFLNEIKNEFNFQLPELPNYASNNAHVFYLLCSNENQRNSLLNYLNNNGIQAVSHYFPLHKSDFARRLNGNVYLEQADYYGNCMIRLPLFYELTEIQIKRIVTCVKEFYNFEKTKNK